MPAVIWTKNEKFITSALTKMAGVTGTDWLAYLDALGKVEGNDNYGADNGKGYVGIYQFASLTNSQSIFYTLDFTNSIGAMLGASSDFAFKHNPITQELAALMEFSGTAPVSNSFSSLFLYARNAAPAVGFSTAQFDAARIGVGPLQGIDMTIFTGDFGASQRLRSAILISKAAL